MSTLRYSAATIDAQTAAVTALLDGGWLQIYEGTQPADGDSPITGSTLLVELQFSSPAFGAPTNGTAWANALAPGMATNTGNAAWCRTLQSDHTSVVFDGDVATSGALLNLDRLFIQAGANVFISDFMYESPKT